ncbi:MAG: prepilin-type N-terminal cleavage/methylation domain-containing protein [Candidatus Kerfeldbacteria bacterium]|nr:prepilin-type N-terminal cleavage/methylation domain-containing protein [Candidatus Kerfeldbacteria bacterium]
MQRSGFTLLELLLSVAMIAILTSMVIPFSRSYYTKNGLSLATDSTVQAIRQAEHYARAQINDTQWGVYVTTGRIVVFSGNTYATRVEVEDITFEISNTITISGTSEFVFEKLTALPTTTGTLTLTDVDGKVANIQLSSRGMVSIQ